MVIREDTPIEELVEAGIVPEWMWRDIRPHGIDEAGHILNEWDWEYGWDIGDGYSKQEREELERVRKIIREGIEAFRSNPEAIRQHKEERERKKRHDNLIREFKAKYSSNCDWNNIPWLVEFYETYGELPYIYLLVTKFVWRKESLTSRHRARLLLAGVNVPWPLSVDEVCTLVPEFTQKQVARWSKHTATLYGNYKDFVSNLHTQLPDRPLPEDDSFWLELSDRQNLDGVAPLQLIRLIALLRSDYSITVSDGLTTLIRN